MGLVRHYIQSLLFSDQCCVSMREVICNRAQQERKKFAMILIRNREYIQVEIRNKVCIQTLVQTNDKQPTTSFSQ